MQLFQNKELQNKLRLAMNKLNHENYGPAEMKNLLQVMAPNDLEKKGNLDSNLILGKFCKDISGSMLKMSSVDDLKNLLDIF